MTGPDEQAVVDVLIAAREQADEIGELLAEIPTRLVRSVVVIDRGSKDATAQAALDGGAVVLRDRGGGMGQAWRRGISHLEALPRQPDIVVFLPSDGRYDPADLERLVEPVASHNAELAVAVANGGGDGMSRVGVELIAALYRHRFGDVGRFRAIRFPALVALGLRDRKDGWEAEMLVKSLRLGLQVAEVPVQLRRDRVRRGALHRRAARVGRSVLQIVRHSTSR